jgi:hypothetical protein
LIQLASTSLLREHLSWCLEGRADGTELDVGEDDSSARGLLLNDLGCTRGGSAGTTGNTRLGRVGISGVGGVEPQHVDRMIVPERHDQDVAASKRGSHSVKATLGLEGRGITKDGLLLVAESVSDGVTSNTLDSRVTVGISDTILDVEALDLRESGTGADELGDNGHWLGGVELRAGAVEVGHTHAVAVEITAVLVAETVIAVASVTAGGIGIADLDTSTRARVRSVSRGDRVGLPDVHLGAACTELAGSGVRVRIRGVPALKVGHAVHEFQVVGALGITVAGSELGTSLVVALAKATIGGHLYEVESTVETARQLGNIDIDGELLADEVEHLVLCVALHEVGTRSNVGAVLILLDELQAQSIAAGGDTVCA